MSQLFPNQEYNPNFSDFLERQEKSRYMFSTQPMDIPTDTVVEAGVCSSCDISDKDESDDYPYWNNPTIGHIWTSADEYSSEGEYVYQKWLEHGNFMDPEEWILPTGEHFVGTIEQFVEKVKAMHIEISTAEKYQDVLVELSNLFKKCDLVKNALNKIY